MSLPSDWPDNPSMQTYSAIGLANRLDASMDLTVHKTGRTDKWTNVTIVTQWENTFHFKDQNGRPHRARYEDITEWSLDLHLEGTNP